MTTRTTRFLTAAFVALITLTTANLAWAEPSVAGLDRQIAQTERLIRDLKAGGQVTAEAEAMIRAKLREIVEVRDMIAKVDRKIARVEDIVESQVAAYIRMAKLYNSRRHRLSQAGANKVLRLLKDHRDKVERNRQLLDNWRAARDKGTANLSSLLAKLNAGLTYMRDHFRASPNA